MACLESLKPWPLSACPVCGQDQTEPGLCGTCQTNPPEREETRHLFTYEGTARDILHSYKFKTWFFLSRAMAIGMVPRLYALGPEFNDAPLVPVPQHALRWLRYRFNPVGELTKQLSALAGHPVRILLRTTRHRPAQSRLRARERRAIPSGTYRFKTGNAPGRAILIDDVFTTGSTIQACVSALKRGGVHRVAVITFSRTPQG